MNLISQDAIDVERWRRIESVLDPALDLEPHLIPDYLDRACAGSPELRKEIEALLEADRRAAGFLSVPALAMVNPFADEDTGVVPGGVSRTALAEPPPPVRVGRYRIVGELGRGGMGVVYRGVDETIDREVAIKTLPAAVASDPGRLARFLVEARLLGALHHPHIAGIHGVEWVDGRRHLILELVQGRSLSEILRAGPLPLAEALDVCAQVAEALVAAHALGVVHRDLKPANIMRTPGGLVKVLDLGLAMHVAHADAAPVDAERGGSATGARLGTPGYMSPEQILGLHQDSRADLFALGAVLYECLTGSRAFPGLSAFAVIDATLHATIDPGRLPSEISAPVRAVLDRMLEKDPAARLADAGEVASILGRESARKVSPYPGRPAARALRLPRAASPRIGREREIDEVLRLLERARIVTLTGSAGCGKTRLAIEIARDAHRAGVDEVWFADLAAAADSADLAAAVAAAADLRDPSERGLEDALAARLGGRTILLVLDSCERLPGPCAALVGRLHDRCPGLLVLATSREWLGVAGEQTVRVPPLSLPDPEGPHTRQHALSSEAVRLFVSGADATRSGFRLTDTNAALVCAICVRLAGLPLAIELTAALLRQLDLEQVARDLGVGESDAAFVPLDRQDPLRAALQLGYDRLDDDERGFFRGVSVFAGAFTLEAATAVCDATADDFLALDRLTRLIDKSLVVIEHADRVDRVEPRYRLLEPIRAFAAVRREEARESDRLRERHRDWFLAVAERAAPSLLHGSDQARWLAVLEADHADLLAALDGCAGVRNGASLALRITGSVWLFWYVRGHFARGRAALARALGMVGADAETPARAQALFAAGGLALFQGDFTEGRRLSQSALALYQRLDDRLGVARSLSHLALCESGEGRHGEARVRTEQAIAIFRVEGDARRLSAALNNLGALKRQHGDYGSSLPDYEEALELRRRADDRDGMIVTLVNLALAASRLGRGTEAGCRIDEALALAGDLRAKRAGSSALEVAAEVLAERGRIEDATRVFGAARALRAAIGIVSDEWWRKMEDELAERLGSALGADRFAGLIAEAKELSFERSVAIARRALAPEPVEENMGGAS